MLFHIVEKKKRSRPMSPKAQLEHEKRIRREIANSNERRRMQCINAGFQSLRALMPQLNGEKLSKAAILQHTTEYIANIEQEKKRLLAQNEHLKHMLIEIGREREIQKDLPPPKRKKRDTESSDEGISLTGSVSDGCEDQSAQDLDLQREMLQLRQQLNHERVLRIMVEDRARSLEAQLYRPQHHSPLPAHVDAPINLKMESPKELKSVQEVSEEQTFVEPRYPCMPGRNLENLVEAIRQIEGDRMLCDERKFPEHPTSNSEESEKETESPSEAEESKSESWGRDSPSPVGLCTQHAVVVRSTIVSGTPQVCRSSPQICRGSYSEKYPIASHLLHRPSFTQFYRPGVIVHKS